MAFNNYILSFEIIEYVDFLICLSYPILGQSLITSPN